MQFRTDSQTITGIYPVQGKEASYLCMDHVREFPTLPWVPLSLYGNSYQRMVSMQQVPWLPCVPMKTK